MESSRTTVQTTLQATAQLPGPAALRTCANRAVYRNGARLVGKVSSWLSMLPGGVPQVESSLAIEHGIRELSGFQ